MRHFNAVVLGAGGVGKSALTVRFFRDQFLDHYDPTIEETYHKTILVENDLCSLEVMDTAGVEQFTTVSEQYIQAAKGFLLVFSLAQEASLQEVEKLRQQIARIKGTRVPIVVVGTKSDLTAEREVRRSTIGKLAAEWDLPFYETSAKRNHHVADAFNDLVRQMYARYPPPTKPARRRGGSCVIM